MIVRKTAAEIEIMARGGRLTGETLRLLGQSVRPGINTQELDLVAEEFIRSHPGAQPAFKGLYGFPASCCRKSASTSAPARPSSIATCCRW